MARPAVMLFAAFTVMLPASVARAACADRDSSSIRVAYTQSYPAMICVNTPGGQPRKNISIVPSGAGETLASQGIVLEVVIRDEAGNPCAGFAASDVELRAPTLSFCRPMHPDGPSDVNGVMRFSGTIFGGGCANRLEVWTSGNILGFVDVLVNGPDAPGTSPGYVDAADLSALAARLGAVAFPTMPNPPVVYDFCFDWNEDGCIDASEVARFASHFPNQCPD